jgi:hypothetical protein
MARHRPDSQVPTLIERIRKLVAEQRRLEKNGSGDGVEEKRREVERLQTRLANAVRRELKTRATAILETPQRA